MTTDSLPVSNCTTCQAVRQSLIQGLVPYQRRILDAAEEIAPDGQPLSADDLAIATGSCRSTIYKVRVYLLKLGLWRWPKASNGRSDDTIRATAVARRIADRAKKWDAVHVRRVQGVVIRARTRMTVKGLTPLDLLRKEVGNYGCDYQEWNQIPMRPTKYVPLGFGHAQETDERKPEDDRPLKMIVAGFVAEWREGRNFLASGKAIEGSGGVAADGDDEEAA